MRTALVWLVSAICSLLNPIGLILLFVIMADEEYNLLIAPAIAAVIGFIFGFLVWDETVAPRMFWVKSRTDLFENRLGASFKFMIGFFSSACVITFLVLYLLN